MTLYKAHRSLEDMDKNQNYRTWWTLEVALDYSKNVLISLVEKEMHSLFLTLTNNTDDGKQRRKMKCTTDDIVARLTEMHRNRSPALHNTEGEWPRSSWGIIKAFLPSKGYQNVCSMGELDFNGVISIILNCLHFEEKVNADLSLPSNVFSRVRNARKQLLNSSKRDITDEELKRGLQDIIEMITAVAKTLKKEAKEAIKQIQKIQKNASRDKRCKECYVSSSYARYQICEMDTEDIIDLAGQSKTSDFGVCRMARLDMQKRAEKDAQKDVELPKPNVWGSKRRETEDVQSQVTNSSSDAMLEDGSGSTRPIGCTDMEIHESSFIGKNNDHQKYDIDNMQAVSTTGISKHIQIISEIPDTSDEDKEVLKYSCENKGQKILIDGRNGSGNENKEALQIQACCHENKNQHKVIPEGKKGDSVAAKEKLRSIEFSSDDTVEDNCYSFHVVRKKDEILLQLCRSQVFTEKDQRGTCQVVADTLKLTVPENEIKRELRNYTFFELQDLQSRLMLVTGKAEKGNENVDRFTMPLSQSGTKIQEEELQSVVPLTGSNLRTGGRQKELKNKWIRREVKWTQNFHHAVVTLILFLRLIFYKGRSSRKKGTLKALIFIALFAVCAATDCDRKWRSTEHPNGIVTHGSCELCDLDKPPDPCNSNISDFFAAGGKAGIGKTTLINAWVNQSGTCKDTKLRNEMDRLFVKKPLINACVNQSETNKDTKLRNEMGRLFVKKITLINVCVNQSETNKDTKLRNEMDRLFVKKTTLINVCVNQSETNKDTKLRNEMDRLFMKKTTLIKVYVNQSETSKDTKLRNVRDRLFVKILDDNSKWVLLLTIQDIRYTSDDWIIEDLEIDMSVQIEDAFLTGLEYKYILCILSLDIVSECCCSPECLNMKRGNHSGQHSGWHLAEEYHYRNKFYINTEKVNSSKELPFNSVTVKSLDHSVSKRYTVLLSGFTITIILSVMLCSVSFKVIWTKSCKLCAPFENLVKWILLLTCHIPDIISFYGEKNKIPPEVSHEGKSCVQEEQDGNEERDTLMNIAGLMENTRSTKSNCVNDDLLNSSDGMEQDILNFRATSSKDTEDKYLLSDKPNMASVGALIWNDNVLGITFRVGSKYVMTSLHAIRHVIGEDKIAEVDFNTFDDRLTSTSHILILKKIVFWSEELDIAVIEISNLPFDDFSISMTCKYKNPGMYFEKYENNIIKSSQIEKRNFPNIVKSGHLHKRDLNLYQYFLCERTWNLDLYIEHGASGSLEIFSKNYMKKTCSLIANTLFEDPADFILRITKESYEIKPASLEDEQILTINQTDVAEETCAHSCLSCENGKLPVYLNEVYICVQGKHEAITHKVTENEESEINIQNLNTEVKEVDEESKTSEPLTAADDDIDIHNFVERKGYVPSKDEDIIFENLKAFFVIDLKESDDEGEIENKDENESEHGYFIRQGRRTSDLPNRWTANRRQGSNDAEGLSSDTHYLTEIEEVNGQVGISVLIPSTSEIPSKLGASQPLEGDFTDTSSAAARDSIHMKLKNGKSKLKLKVVPTPSQQFQQQSNVKTVKKTKSESWQMSTSNDTFQNLKYKVKADRSTKRNVDCTLRENDFDLMLAVREFTWLPMEELPKPKIDRITVAYLTQFEPLMAIIDQIANGTPPTPHVSMRYELLRFCTLRSYPKENKPYLIKLAEAGFYYASDGDGVVCYCCGVRRYNWVAEDNPMKIHERINPNCKFLRKNEEVNVPVKYFGPFSKSLMAIMDIPEPRERAEQSEDVNNDWAPERVRSPAPAQQNRTTETGANSLGINTAVPKHTQYATKTAREGSYSGWPDTASHTPQELAEAGFFYAGFGDCVRCFYCGIGLRHWTKDDNPWIEHARWSRNCVFVKQKKGEEFVNLVQLAVQYSQDNEAQSNTSEAGNQLPAQEIERILLSDAAQSVLEMGYQPRIIKKAIEQILRQSADTKITAEILMEKVLEIEEAENPAQAAPAPPKAKPAPQTAKPEVSKPVEGAQAAAVSKTEEKPEGDKTSVEGKDKDKESKDLSAEAASQDPKAIKAENEQLKEQTLCKVCLDNTVCIVFLPCGHLVTCADCAPAMRKCPICRALVKGTVRTYMS